MKRRTFACGLGLALSLACVRAPVETARPAVPPDAGAVAAPAPVPDGGARVPGEQVLAVKPTPPPLPHFEAPVPDVHVLSNGLKVYLLHRPESAMEAIQLVIKRGSSADPAKLPGLASLASEMLEAGSAGKSQAQVAQAVDAIGGSLSAGASRDATLAGISATALELDAMSKLLADVALRPNLDPAQWKKIQAERLSELIAERARPEVAADLAFRAAMYGDHPLGRPTQGTAESVKKIQLAQVKSFIQSFSPDEAALVAVGGAPTDRVLASLEAAFGGWKRGKAVKVPTSAEPAPAERPRLVVVDYPGKPQSVLRIGQPSVPRSSPDYLALQLANELLGGSFTSRLNVNLREKHGYTYGVRSGFAFGVGPGPFYVGTNVKTDVTAAAVRETMFEIRDMLSAPLSQADLEKGKALLAADLVRDLQTSESAAEAVAAIFAYDLPLDEYRTYVQRLQALTAEDVMAALRRALQPEKMTITIAGDAAKVLPLLKAEKELASLPPPQRRNNEGALIR